MSVIVTSTSLQQYANLATGCVAPTATTRATLSGYAGSQQMSVFDYHPICINMIDTTSENVTNNATVSPSAASATLTWSYSPLSFSGASLTTPGTTITVQTQPGAQLRTATLSGASGTVSPDVPVRENLLSVVMSGIQLSGTATTSTGGTTVTINPYLTYAFEITDPTACTPSVVGTGPALLSCSGIYYVGSRGATTVPYAPIQSTATVTPAGASAPIYAHLNLTQGDLSHEVLLPLASTAYAWTNIPGTNAYAIQIISRNLSIQTSTAFVPGTAVNASLTLVTTLHAVAGDKDDLGQFCSLV